MQAGVFVTGGEDSRVALWNAAALNEVPDVPMEDDNVRRKRGWEDGEDREVSGRLSSKVHGSSASAVQTKRKRF